MVVAAGFPWDVAIAAVSTLAAGLGATWWAGHLARAGQVTHWRLEEQRAAAEEVLRSWSRLYIALARAALEGRRAFDQDGQRTGPLADFTEWVAALERLSLVGERDLVTHAVALDAEIWRFHVCIGELGDLVNIEWSARTRPVHEARLRFVNAARRVLGSRDEISDTQGRPPLDDPIWSEAHWEAERRRLEAEAAADPSIEDRRRRSRRLSSQVKRG